MAEGKAADLSSWLDACAERGTVRVAARDDTGWIDRRELVKNIETFSVEPVEEPSTRYRLTLDEGDDALRLDERVRLVYRVVGVNDDQELQRDNVELLVELPAGVVETPPDFGGTVQTLPADVLRLVDSEDHEDYASASANRVAGLEAEKRELVRFLETGNRRWGLSEPTGIILEGPPGTGKTELVMEVCQEKYGALPVTISGPEVLSKWVGESERLLREKFEDTLETSHRILYIDELDAIARTRAESSQDITAQLVSQLLVLLDGVEAKQDTEDDRPLRVIASTNIAQVIDPALLRPGRLGNRPIQVGRPSERARTTILHHYLERIHASSDGRLDETLRRAVTSTDGLDVLKRLARRMEGFTGADIEDVVQEAVSQVRTEERAELSIEFLSDILESGFSASSRYRTREYTPRDLEGVAAGPVDDQRVFELPRGEASVDAAERVAKQYFASIAESAPSDRRFVFRAVSPRHLLAADRQRTREETAAAFQHVEAERLCLYVEGLSTLARAHAHSSLVRTVIEVANEQLIQWNEENVLIVEADEDVDSLLCIE